MAKYEIKDGVGIIPDGETTIANMAFTYCEELTKVVIPSSVTTIGREAFKGCKNLESVEIPSNVTSIYAYAFAGCSALKSINIHKNLSMIGLQAFDGCGALTSIVVEEGNFMYDSRNNCNAIINSATNTLLRGCCNTTIPEGTEVIDSYAFSGCKGLTSIVIPEGVKKIEKYAFFCCHDLTSVVIPKSVTEISKYGVFSHCESLTSIVVEEGNSIYDSRENCNAIIKNGTTLVAGCSNSVIPNGVEKLEDNAFCGCENLTNIVIPASVTEIGANAFSDCTALTEIVIPDSVEYIGERAFYNSGLTSIEVPESVKDLNGVFMKCEKLKTATVKGKLEDYRADCVFPFKDCPALETLTFLDCVRYIKEESCNGCKSLKNISVPAKKGDYYKKRFTEELHPLIVELEAKKKK
ncbi:MAG: leucine-rich repeat domain-containing protein [Alistipes sp.]|nr:leucine-rich repeat domain-containing protein [Alistipes sp.]